MNTASLQAMTAPVTDYSGPVSSVRHRHADLEHRGVAVRAFAVTTPDGVSHAVGTGSPAFTLRLANTAGVAAVASFDELKIAEAFMNGELDIDGGRLQSLRYR